jgi:hypothetical protein
VRKGPAEVNGIVETVAGLALNECVDLCPWLARGLVDRAARLQYPDPVLARIHAEVFEHHVGNHGLKLVQLLVALGFLAKATSIRLGRAFGGEPGDVGVPDIIGVDYVPTLTAELGKIGDLRTLSAGRRRTHDRLVAGLGDLLRCPPRSLAADDLRPLLAAAARVSTVLVEDRDEFRAADLLRIARDRARLDEYDPVQLDLRFAQAVVDVQLGRPARAVAELTEVLVRRHWVLGPEHHDTQETGRWLAWARAECGDLTDADAVLSALASVDDEQRLHTACMRSWVWHRAGRSGEAVAGYADVISGRSRAIGRWHPDTLDSRHSRAKVHYQRGEHGPARAEAFRVWVARWWVNGRTHLDTLESRKLLALARFEGDRREDRLVRELQRVLLLQLRRRHPRHPYVVHTTVLLTEHDAGDR